MPGVDERHDVIPLAQLGEHRLDGRHHGQAATGLAMPRGRRFRARPAGPNCARQCGPTPDQLEERALAHDRDRRGGQIEKVAIAGHQVVGRVLDRQCEQVVVVRVSGRGREPGWVVDLPSRAEHIGHEPLTTGRANQAGDLRPGQHVSHLPDQPRAQQVVEAALDARGHDQAGDAARGDRGGHEDTRVEDDDYLRGVASLGPGRPKLLVGGGEALVVGHGDAARGLVGGVQWKIPPRIPPCGAI